MKTPWLIVGAGFTGAVLAERIARVLGEDVLVRDQRPHLAGNAHDPVDAAGFRIHAYGPHIFHTNAEAVVGYLSAFTEWRPYEHRVQAVVRGLSVPLPFNLNALAMLFPPAEAAALEAKLLATYGAEARIPVHTLCAAEDPALAGLGRFVYASIYLPYSLKQWGVAPDAFDPAVLARVPVAVSRDDRYFTDRFQAMPAAGYDALFARLLDHPRIRVELGVRFDAARDADAYERLIYTGPLDAYFGHAYGHLPYRSLRFEHSLVPEDRHQPVAVVNHPGAEGFTRVTEFKHLTGQVVPGSALCTEFPQAHVAGENEPYYPVVSADSRAMLVRYRAEAAKLSPRVLFAGRLADYQYYNMDQVVARALTLFSREIAPPGLETVIPAARVAPAPI